MEIAKLQRVKNPSQMNRDNMNTGTHENSTPFRNKKRKYSKNKINELETNSKNKNVRHMDRDINELKKVINLYSTWGGG
jgi:hypothetical protein